PSRIGTSTPYSTPSSQRAIAPRPRLSQNTVWMNTRSMPDVGFSPLAQRYPPSAPANISGTNIIAAQNYSAANSQSSVRSVHIQPLQAYGYMLPNAPALPAPTVPAANTLQTSSSASSSRSSGNFRLEGKSFFLTYPRCNLDLNVILTELEKIMSFDKYIIAREKHASGEPHIHVFLSRFEKKATRNPKFFDILGFHGNYQTCRSSKSVMAYVAKDKDYITNMPESAFPHLKKSAVQRYFEAETVEEALEVAKNSNDLGRDYIRNAELFEKSARYLKERPVELVPFKDPSHRFIPPHGIRKWDRTKQALMLFGKTGTGKSSYAETLFNNPLVVNSLEDLKRLRPVHDGIVFDEFNPLKLKLPRETMIMLTNVEFHSTVSVKHGSVTIPRLLPRVFLTNVKIFYNDPAIVRRVKTIPVNSSLILDKDVILIDSDDDTESDDDELDNRLYFY
ncbi:Replication-associated protein, partial [Smittium culicis]